MTISSVVLNSIDIFRKPEPRYQPRVWKEKKEKPFTLYLAGAADMGEALAESAAVTAGVCFARDLVNLPANKLTPEMMAQQVTRHVALHGPHPLGGLQGVAAGVKAHGLAHQGQGGLSGLAAPVAQDNEPGGMAGAVPHRVIGLHAKGPGLLLTQRLGLHPRLLGGLGDLLCHGYSLKTAQGMRTMKCDMAGGAAVAGAMLATPPSIRAMAPVRVAMSTTLAAPSFVMA